MRSPICMALSVFITKNIERSQSAQNREQLRNFTRALTEFKCACVCLLSFFGISFGCYAARERGWFAT